QAARPAAAHSTRGGPARPGPAAAQATGPTFFFSHSSSLLRRPICSTSSAFSASASVEAAWLPLLKTWSAPARSCFFQAWTRVGWTPYWLASSLTVLSPRTAARASWALNAAVCCFRLRAIVSPFLGHQSSLEVTGELVPAPSYTDMAARGQHTENSSWPTAHFTSVNAPTAPPARITPAGSCTAR